jgi:hypothetical protein
VERWIHHHQIRRALGSTELDYTLSSPAIEAIVMGFKDRIPSLGGIAIGERVWTFRSGGQVSIDPASAVTVLSRARPLEDTIATLTGDPTLVDVVARQSCRVWHTSFPS